MSSRRLIRSTALVGFLSALSCDHPTAPNYSARLTAAEAYTPRDGEMWTFVNGYGDTTTITTRIVAGSAACRSGQNVVWHYEKTQGRAYWQPGIAGATIDFVLHQDPDSSWRSTASVIAYPQSCPWCNGPATYTWDVLDNTPPAPNGYRITPPTLNAGQRVTYETRIDAVGGADLHTLACVAPTNTIVALPGHGLQWRTEFYLEDVDTPIYTGPAAVSEQWENCNDAHTNPGCGHEKWWFAPNLGLVKVHQINSGSGVDGDMDPRIIMQRISGG